MEYVFLILALLSAVASVAMLIGNVLNHGLRVLLTIRGVKLIAIKLIFCSIPKTKILYHYNSYL